MQNKNKTLIDGLWVERKDFGEDNYILKLNILPDQFLKQFNSLGKTQKGYVRLVISKKKKLGENGQAEYYCYHDDFGVVSQDTPINNESQKPKTNYPPKKQNTTI